MMAIPADLTDFAVGFSLNEGIVSAARDIESLDIIKTDDGTLLRRWLSGPPAAAFWERRRYLAGPRPSGLLLIALTNPSSESMERKA
jgi:FdhD protein